MSMSSDSASDVAPVPSPPLALSTPSPEPERPTPESTTKCLEFLGLEPNGIRCGEGVCR